jgi:hypothetical protein
MSPMIRGNSMKVSPGEFSAHIFPPDCPEGRNKKSSISSVGSKVGSSAVPSSKIFMINASKTESMLNYVRSKRVGVEESSNNNVEKNSVIINVEVLNQKQHSLNQKGEFLIQKEHVAKLNGEDKTQLKPRLFSITSEGDYYDAFLRFSSKKFQLEKVEEEFRLFRASDVNITLGVIIAFWAVVYFFLRSNIFSFWYGHMDPSFFINFLLLILALFACAFVFFNRLAIVSKENSILYSCKESSAIRMNSYGHYIEDSLVYFSAIIPVLNLLGRVLMGFCAPNLSSFRLQVLRIHIYTCIYTYICMHIHIFSRIFYIHIYIYIYMYMYIYTPCASNLSSFRLQVIK